MRQSIKTVIFIFNFSNSCIDFNNESIFIGNPFYQGIKSCLHFHMIWYWKCYFVFLIMQCVAKTWTNNPNQRRISIKFKKKQPTHPHPPKNLKKKATKACFLIICCLDVCINCTIIMNKITYQNIPKQTCFYFIFL